MEPPEPPDQIQPPPPNPFALPPLIERPCAQCATETVVGPPGTLCGGCHAAREREEWRHYVDAAYHEARHSVPDVYRGATFANDDHRDAEVTSAVSRLGHRTAVFVGPAHAGKTWFACAVFHQRLHEASVTRFPRDLDKVAEDERRVSALGASRYVRAFTLGAAPAWDPVWALWRAAPVMVIDDLGLEPAAFAPAIIDLVIVRCDHRRQTLVTTSFTEDAVGARYGEGVLRRLSAASRWLVCG